MLEATRARTVRWALALRDGKQRGARARSPGPPPTCATARGEVTDAKTASAGDECIGAPNVEVTGKTGLPGLSG